MANIVGVASRPFVPSSGLTSRLDVGHSAQDVRAIKFATVELLACARVCRYKLHWLVGADVLSESCILRIDFSFCSSEPDLGRLRKWMTCVEGGLVRGCNLSGLDLIRSQLVA